DGEQLVPAHLDVIHPAVDLENAHRLRLRRIGEVQHLERIDLYHVEQVRAVAGEASRHQTVSFAQIQGPRHAQVVRLLGVDGRDADEGQLAGGEVAAHVAGHAQVLAVEVHLQLALLAPVEAAGDGDVAAHRDVALEVGDVHVLDGGLVTLP